MTDLYQEKQSRFRLKNGFIIRNCFPYTIPICRILYKLKLYYAQLMESFNMNNFLVWVCFNFKKYLCNCKNHKIWKHFIINQLINPSRTISEWELSVTRCYLCYSLRFNCSWPYKSPCSTEHHTHAALQTHVSMCAASSKSAFSIVTLCWQCSVWRRADRVLLQLQHGHWAERSTTTFIERHTRLTASSCSQCVGVSCLTTSQLLAKLFCVFCTF